MNCQQVQPRLSEYIDNALSARDTWEVDRHLAACRDCSRALGDMRLTVRALQAAPRQDVSSEFMERLQARLEGLQPEPQRSAWLASLRDAVRPRAFSLAGLSMATCALVVVLLVMPRTPDRHALPPGTADVETARVQNVALSASDPLGDVATENLAATQTAEAQAEPEGAR